MSFDNPDAFLLFWLLPILILCLVLGIRLRRRRLQKFASLENLRGLVPAYSKLRIFCKGGLFIGAYTCLVIGLAEPKWGFEWREVQQKGVDIMLALDVSRSMKAQDIKPNRLERARREIIDLINLLQGDRIGLIAFAGVGFVQCPLTTDYKAVAMFLDHLNEELIPVPGTSLGDAIRLGVKSLKEASELNTQGKAMILITDGEDQDSQPVEAAEDALKEGVKVFTIGMGQDSGAPIPLPQGGFKKDANGNVVVTRLGEATLQKIAAITGGRYVRSTTGDLDLRDIYFDGIRNKMEAGEIKSSRQKLWYMRGHIFALVALVLLFASISISETAASEKLGRVGVSDPSEAAIVG